MATAPLSTKAVGSIVKIPVNGIMHDFIVVHHGRPSNLYDTSFDNGTIVLKRDPIVENMEFSSAGSNNYPNSEPHGWLNKTFMDWIAPNIRPVIKTVKVPYCRTTGYSQTVQVSTGPDGLSSRAFLLSGVETGNGQGESSGTRDGTTLAYFAGGGKAVTARAWWLRSPVTFSTNMEYAIGAGGSIFSYDVNSKQSVRPALVIVSISKRRRNNNHKHTAVSSAGHNGTRNNNRRYGCQHKLGNFIRRGE